MNIGFMLHRPRFARNPFTKKVNLRYTFVPEYYNGDSDFPFKRMFSLGWDFFRFFIEW